MTLEDRLRRGFDRHDADTAVRLGAPEALPPFAPRPRGLAAPAALTVVAVLLLAGFGVFLFGGPTVVTDDLDPAIGTVVESTSTLPATTVPGVADPTITNDQELGSTTEVAPPSTAAPPSTRAADSDGSSATTLAPSTSQPSSTAPAGTAATTASTSATPPTSPVPAGYSAVLNQACDSGFRAPLEQAVLRYVGPNQGWGRIDDLVDEQDGPYYFEAWEPGYPDEVTVEVVLAEPVNATEIMVAQDPFTPVSGAIDIQSSVVSGQIELSGTEGWRALVLPSTPKLSSFTIRRDDALENIMEVLVCVQDPVN